MEKQNGKAVKIERSYAKNKASSHKSTSRNCKSNRQELRRSLTIKDYSYPKLIKKEEDSIVIEEMIGYIKRHAYLIRNTGIIKKHFDDLTTVKKYAKFLSLSRRKYVDYSEAKIKFDQVRIINSMKVKWNWMINVCGMFEKSTPLRNMFTGYYLNSLQRTGIYENVLRNIIDYHHEYDAAEVNEEIIDTIVDIESIILTSNRYSEFIEPLQDILSADEYNCVEELFGYINDLEKLISDNWSCSLMIYDTTFWITFCNEDIEYYPEWDNSCIAIFDFWVNDHNDVESYYYSMYFFKVLERINYLFTYLYNLIGKEDERRLSKRCEN
jgi:hypothetical protein